MKVKELILKLAEFDLDAEVAATWEGIVNPFEVYEAADGRVLIDADYSRYKLVFQETPCHICGKQARMQSDAGPVCYSNHKAEKDQDETE